MEPKEYIERQTLDRLSAENPSTKDLGDGIRMLYSRLWSKEELTNLIAQTHHRLCAKCTKNDDQGWYQKVIWALITAGCTALAYFCKNRIERRHEMKTVFFKREPELQPLANGKWRLAKDWQIIVGHVSMTVPAGFETDGASVPKFLWRICGHPMEAPRIYAAIVHDWLYSGAVPGVTRARADGIYRDIMIGTGCGRTKSHVEWLALRLCGRSHWYKKQQKGKRK